MLFVSLMLYMAVYFLAVAWLQRADFPVGIATLALLLFLTGVFIRVGVSERSKVLTWKKVIGKIENKSSNRNGVGFAVDYEIDGEHFLKAMDDNSIGFSAADVGDPVVLLANLQNPREVISYAGASWTAYR